METKSKGSRRVRETKERKRGEERQKEKKTTSGGVRRVEVHGSMGTRPAMGSSAAQVNSAGKKRGWCMIYVWAKHSQSSRVRRRRCACVL